VAGVYCIWATTPTTRRYAPATAGIRSSRQTESQSCRCPDWWRERSLWHPMPDAIFFPPPRFDWIAWLPVSLAFA